MRTGNITISGRPNPDDLRDGMICEGCEEECEEVGLDESFADGLGNVTCWSVGSSCCGAGAFQGRLWLDVTTTHRARKDHYARGKVIVEKGKRYRCRVTKGYYIDDDGNRRGIFNVTKRQLPDQDGKS